MIFYIATDADTGRKTICGTQAEAKAIDRNFEQTDIPVDKNGLKAFVQESLDAIFELQGQVNSAAHDSSIAPVTIETSAPKPAPVHPIRTEWTATEIEDFILNRASVAQVENLFGCLGNRFAELRKHHEEALSEDDDPYDIDGIIDRLTGHPSDEDEDAIDNLNEGIQAANETRGFA